MKNNKVIITVATALLVSGFLLFSAEKLQVTNIYVKPVVADTNTNPQRPVTDVDYTPETSPPDGSINSEKNPSDLSTTNPNSSVTVSITRANQDPTTKNLNIGVLIDGTKTGNCKLELFQNSVAVVTKTADITEQSGLFTCAGFTLLASEIPTAGTYDLKISVATASTTQKVELKK